MPFRIENLYIPPVPPIQLSFVPKNTAQLCDLDMNYFNMVSIAGLVKTKVGTENLEKLLKDINNLNNCIEHYNQLQCYDTYLFYRDCKIIGLRYIEESAQAMDDSFDDQTILYLPHYQNYIYDELLSAIQKQKKLLCISFQYEKLSFLTPRTSFDLKESVHLLSYNQVSILITLLAKRVPFTTSLFIDPHFPYDFQSVWSLYELQFIHAGNSICYTMRRTFDTSESYYLKVENYLNHHKAVERRLRKKLSTVPELSDFILPIYAECRARYFHPDDYYTMGRLVLSSYCNQKDLKRYIKKNNKKNKVLPHFVLKVMLLLIEKISIILAHGFISTDLKLSNILVNENPDTQAISLHISDCKSFQQYDTNTGVLNYTNIIVTADHRPPEIIMRTDAIYNKVDAEAVVVYLVGRMLQEGLFLYNQNNPKTENIDPVDKKISHLIRRMLSIQPHKRPKIASVQKSIQSLCMEPEAYYKHECMLALQKLNEYQFSGQAWIKSFSEETLDNLSKESDLEQLISLSTNVQERLQPLLNNAIINAYKEKWAACMQRYHILLSSREFDADYDFMALQQEIMSFQAGETTDYANNFLFLKEKINQKYSALVTKTWHWLNNSRSMLDRMLHCQFDDDDMEVLTYIDEKSQLLVMNMQNIPQIKMIHSEIKDMLFHLETEDLKQIRLTIQELRLPKQTTFCGIAYFFSHKRQIAHFAANERKAETIVKTMRALPLSQRSQIRQVLDTVEPHTQKIFRQINWRQSASSTKVAPIF